MSLPNGYALLEGSEHPHPPDRKVLRPADPGEQVTFTVLLKRRSGASQTAPGDIPPYAGEPVSREAFALSRGADPEGMKQVADFARRHDLAVVDEDAAARSIILRGKVADIDRAFATRLEHYSSAAGEYRSHDGPIGLPAPLHPYVAAVTGLTNRKVLATHFSTARRSNPADPPDTRPFTPQEVAALYSFPAGDGSGQLIGLYEMETSGGRAGYAAADIQKTMQGFGLPVPHLIDVPVDGVANSGTSDGETGLDITVAGAIAPGADIAVYFAGGEVQNIIHALQKMIHPNTGDPQPSIISISYGWGPDDEGAVSFSDAEYTQISALFEDAANKHLTVLVSSGDSGAKIADPRQAQVSYPASDIWVTACGGTTLGHDQTGAFSEYVWNDVGAGGPGATGGGVSARFPAPDYQSKVALPVHIVTGKPGRGVPDIAGNASENSGYDQVINANPPQPVGGTSAVAPLYAGLIARINTNLGRPSGFLNPLLYAADAGLYRDIVSPPGPADNSFGGVTGYPAKVGWDACTGLGSLNGEVLQSLLQAQAGQAAPAAAAAQTA